MNKKLRVIKEVVDFFVEEGKIYTNGNEYKVAKGRPYSYHTVRRAVGPWSRVIAWAEKYFPEEMAAAKSGKAVEKPEKPTIVVESASDAAEALAKAAAKVKEKASNNDE